MRKSKLFLTEVKEMCEVARTSAHSRGTHYVPGVRKVSPSWVLETYVSTSKF